MSKVFLLLNKILNSGSGLTELLKYEPLRFVNVQSTWPDTLSDPSHNPLLTDLDGLARKQGISATVLTKLSGLKLAALLRHHCDFKL